MLHIKILFGLITLLGILSGEGYAQTVSGRVVNNLTQGLSGKLVECWATSSGYQTLQSDVTNQLGNFFILITDVEDEQSNVEGIIYSVDNNSPSIRVNTLSRKDVEIKLFDITGQQVYQLNEENFGEKIYALPTTDLANTVYIVCVVIDNQIYANKLLRVNNLVYFGKNVERTNKAELNKLNSELILDSIRVSGEAIETTTFTYGISITGNYNVGNLFVDSAFVTISGQVYKLFDWTQTDRGLEGATIKIEDKTAITGTDGTYSLAVASGLKDVTITHPNAWTRKTKIIANQDATIDFDVMDKTRMPENVLAFYDSLSGRIDFFQSENILKRSVNQNFLFYIVANINNAQDMSFRDWHILKIDSIIKPALITPVYPEGFLKDATIEVGLNPPSDYTDYSYIIRMTDNPPGPGGNAFAYTFPYFNLDSTSNQYKFGETRSAISEYWRNMPAFELNMDRLVVHELTSGLAGIIGRYNSIPSVWNYGPPDEYKNMTETDKYWLLFTFSRMPGNRSPDTDYYVFNADNGLWIKPEEIQTK